MAVTKTDILMFQSASHPSDDTTISGGAISAVQITGGSIGEIFPQAMPIDPSVATTWYYKVFVKNNNGSDTYYSPRFFMANALIQPVASGTIAFTPSSALDGTGKIVRIYGYTSAATPSWTTEDVTLSGTSTVYSVYSYQYVRRVELRSSTSPYTLSSCNANISITRGILLGYIYYDSVNSRGVNGAWGEIEMSLSYAINDTVSVANRLTAPTDGLATPSSLVFSTPNTFATSLLCTAGDNNLDAEEYQGIWLKWTTPAGITGGEDIPLLIQSYGYNAAV